MSPQPLFQEEMPLGIPLSRYTAAISRAVNTAPELSGAWVIAELSDVRITGGHCYMELIEKNDAGTTVAKLRATIWQTTFHGLRRKFYAATQHDIASGMRVLVKGQANHHSVYGLSFNIIDIDPSYTLGDIERIRKEILMRLSKEGVLNLNKNLRLPAAIQKIAVISAEGAAGYGDFINQLSSNNEGFVFYPVLIPAVMQGDRVSVSIRQALSFIESTIDFWDCVAIVRGGGATSDMNGFDDYELAKAVATFPLPIVVGIGHERDRNVLDDIAHTSVKTPTAVAAFFIDSLRQAFDAVLDRADRIRQHSINKLRGEEQRLATLQSLVPQLALRRLADNKSKLKNLIAKLPLLVNNRIGKENMKISGKIELLKSYGHMRVQTAAKKLDHYNELLKVLDPANTIKRGYSITRINGKAVKSCAELEPGTELTTTLLDGEIKSIVSK